MKRFFIEDVKYGVSHGGVGCGPISGNVVVTVKYRTNRETKWLSLVDGTEIPNVYLTDKDVFDNLIKEDYSNQEFTDYFERHCIDSFEHIFFGEYYAVTFECFYRDPELPAIPLVKYLIAFAFANEEEAAKLLEMAIGHYADELIIPDEIFQNISFEG